VANSLLTIDMVTREALRIAHEKAQFIGTVDRQYDSSFANTGAKTGASLRVRKPNQYVRRTGSRVMNVQDQAESNGTITVATQDGVDMRFNSAELALSIDDFSKRYIEPAMAVLVSGIESDFLAFATKATWNVAGTAGTGITTLTVPGAARAKLNQGLAPKDGNRYVQMDSVTMGGMVEGLKGLFQDSTQIKEQYREGMIGRTGMADWYENERLWTMTMGSDVDTVTINDAGFVSGDTTVTITGSTGHAVGQVVTFAGCKAVHAETKAVFPHLQQFVITAVSGNDITISPTPVTSGATQNVNAMPANGAAVTFVGVNSASYIQPLMYHKEAFQFVTADLPLMDDAHKCVRRTHDGLSMRVWQGSDIVNDNLLMRIDILYGMAALRPEWACRLVGAAAA
jgi:P22 coat protein - gene protein 5